MAVRFDASTDTLRRTTNLPDVDAVTLMGWFKISVDRNDYSAFLTIGSSVEDAGDFYVGTGSDGTTLICYNTSADGPNGSALSVGAWNHVALVRQGAGAADLIVYLNGVQDTTHDGGAGTANTTTGIGIGSRTADANDWLNGCAAAVKIYNAVLTAAEIAQERWFYRPVRLANLDSWYPLLHTGEDEIDFSGQGKTLTVGGTLATEDGPPIAWRAQTRRRWYSLSAGGPTIIEADGAAAVVFASAGVSGATAGSVGDSAVVFTPTAVGAAFALTSGASAVVFAVDAPAAAINQAAGASAMTFAAPGISVTILASAGASDIVFGTPGVSGSDNLVEGASAVTFAAASVGAAVSTTQGASAVVFGATAEGENIGGGIVEGDGLVNIVFTGDAVSSSISGVVGSAALQFAANAEGDDAAIDDALAAGIVPVRYIVGVIPNVVPVETVLTDEAGVVDVREFVGPANVVPVREVTTERPRVKVRKV